MCDERDSQLSNGWLRKVGVLNSPASLWPGWGLKGSIGWRRRVVKPRRCMDVYTTLWITVDINHAKWSTVLQP
ncbi:hypothetical protein D3C79_453240 [compost metagenome]